MALATGMVACGETPDPVAVIEPLPASTFVAAPPMTFDCAPMLSEAAGVATEIRGLDLVGDWLYVGDDYGGFRVLDVSDPARPQQVGILPLLTGVSRGVHVVGQYAYLTAADAGLLVIDISTPSVPTLVASLDLPGYTRHARVRDGLAYVADDWEGFRVVDVHDPSAPAVIGEEEQARPAFRVALAGGLAYVASGHAGLRVIDVSKPGSPMQVDVIELGSHVWDVGINASTAFVAADVAGLYVLDISDPGQPVQVAVVDTPGHARSISLVGDFALVADGSAGLPEVDPDPGGYLGVADGEAGLQVIDVSDPTSPWVAQQFDTHGYALVVTGNEQVAFVGSTGDGLRVLDRVEGGEIGHFTQLPGTSRGLALAEEHVLVAAGRTGLRVIYTGGDGPAMEVGAAEVSGEALDVVLGIGEAFVGTSVGVSRVVIPSFEAPSMVAERALEHGASDMTFAGPLIVAAGGASGAVLLDPATANAPVIVGIAAASASAVAAAGSLLAVGGSEGLALFDVSNPATPAALGSLELPPVESMVIALPWGYLAAGGSGVQVVDLSDPAAPRAHAVAVAPGLSHGVTLTGEHLFVSLGDPDHEHNALALFGAAGTGTPVLLTTLGLIEPGVRVALSGNTAFVTASDQGLRVIDIQCPDEGTRSAEPGS